MIKKGTPSHLALLMKRVAAAKVGVRLLSETVGSSVKAGYDESPLY